MSRYNNHVGVCFALEETTKDVPSDMQDISVKLQSILMNSFMNDKTALEMM